MRSGIICARFKILLENTQNTYCTRNLKLKTLKNMYKENKKGDVYIT